jgi:hypothetical protein
VPLPTAPAVPVPPEILGKWDICGKKSLKQLEASLGQHYKTAGFPWFLRQFIMKLFSSIVLVDNGEAGVIVTPVGKFMGLMLPQKQQFNEVPAMEFRNQVPQHRLSRLAD